MEVQDRGECHLQQPSQNIDNLVVLVELAYLRMFSWFLFWGWRVLFQCPQFLQFICRGFSLPLIWMDCTVSKNCYKSSRVYIQSRFLVSIAHRGSILGKREEVFVFSLDTSCSLTCTLHSWLRSMGKSHHWSCA